MSLFDSEKVVAERVVFIGGWENHATIHYFFPESPVRGNVPSGPRVKWSLESPASGLEHKHPIVAFRACDVFTGQLSATGRRVEILVTIF